MKGLIRKRGGTGTAALRRALSSKSLRSESPPSTPNKIQNDSPRKFIMETPVQFVNVNNNNYYDIKYMYYIITVVYLYNNIVYTLWSITYINSILNSVVLLYIGCALSGTSFIFIQRPLARGQSEIW